MTRVFITGITGQDGYYLAKAAHERGYDVYGLIRGQNNPKRQQVEAEQPYIQLIEGDLTSEHSICRAFKIAKPNYVFNLGAITYIPLSWEQPELVYNVNFLGVSRMLEEAVHHACDAFVQASTSEMFGAAVKRHAPDPYLSGRGLNEQSPMEPISPYAISKLAAHHLIKSYKRAELLPATSAIMFNHESPRRGENFVTRKIARAAVRIARGEQDVLELGSNSVRDWGYAPEYMEALLRIAERPSEQDSFVIATGRPATVHEFAVKAFNVAGVSYERIQFDTSANMRVNDVDFLCGDPMLARAVLEWQPQVYWHQLAELMVEAEMREAR